jgi:hypothetical protein
MHTIAPHMVVATILAAGHLGHPRLTLASKAAAQVAGGITLMVLVLAVIILAALASAARGLTALLSEFVRLAAATVSAIFIMAAAAVLAVALLLHH